MKPQLTCLFKWSDFYLHYELYERLLALFRAIDRGDEDWNLPSYNGGLFSESNEQGAFLAEARIPDRDLALGLDRLCRDVDDKTQALVFVDYKSLGVRQLGSIYEGLLEFKLRIARQKLAVIKEKGREVYIPAAKAGRKRVYAELSKGDIYLENDKRERKATGSYYTPDYIVKYIVEHTVGPVLDRRFAELEPRLREAEKQYRSHAKQVAARGGDQSPELFWKKKDMRQLVDDCLDIRVLDPAMGSGHFLVEAVDYISNRLIDFLNAWSHNPVWAMLETIRADILNGMGEQGVTIDPERLTRVVLLKRAVLKRCVYGVDLNPMAVELAKVSLWLDAFTLGAPLSFLDHHLKCGNSLIGARIEEVKEAVEGTADKAVQLSLFSSGAFTGLSMATDLMRQVSYLSDNTIEQVNESRDAYRDADDHLAYYKRVLDLYTSRWFGNTPTKKTDPAVEFIRNNDTREWLKYPQDEPPQAARFDSTQVAQTAFEAAKEKRFFHWELEYPEVYFAPSRPGGQDVQFLKDGGFDVAIGNPPFDELSGYALGEDIEAEKKFFGDVSMYQPAQESSGRLNWYHFFMILGIRLLHDEGLSGFIVPLSWMGDSFTLGVRQWMLIHHTPVLIEAFPQKDDPHNRVFFDAKLPTSLYVTQKNRSKQEFPVRVHPGKEILDVPPYQATMEIIRILNPETWLIPLVSIEEWSVLTKIAKNPDLGPLQEYGAEPTSGEIIFNVSTRPYMTHNDQHELILRGSHVQRYELAEKAKQGTPEYLKLDEYLLGASKDSKAYAFKNPRVVYQEGSAIDAWRRVVPTYLPEGNVCGHKICYFVNYKIDMYTLLAIFASNQINWLVERLSATNSLPAYLIGNLPFPAFTGRTTINQPDSNLGWLRKLYSQGKYDETLDAVINTDPKMRSILVYDFLSDLALEMINLNQAKQNATGFFLSWLEDILRIKPRNDRFGIEALTGFTIIQNFLGDYQKGGPELLWDEFYYRLHQNRNRFGVNLEQVEGQIQVEYEKSLAVLLPIKEQLVATDALIDMIVYQLYGLTEEEIALIEQPAYEQALVDAKAKVLGDKKLQKDTDAAVDAIAEAILPAARRFQARVPLTEDRTSLDEALPGWHLLPDPVPTFLLTGEYNVRTQPDGLDFSTSVIPYTKAIEKTIVDHLLIPFRDDAAASASDCRHPKLQGFLEGKAAPSLGEIKDILRSKKEKALRAHIKGRIPVADETVFGPSGVSELLSDEDRLFKRNRAAHDTVLTRADAEEIRSWALTILRYL